MEYVCYGCFCNSLDENGICTVCGYDHRKNREAYPQALPAGTVLDDRYIVGKVLGQDHCGIAYLAQDNRTKTLVTVQALSEKAENMTGESNDLGGTGLYFAENGAAYCVMAYEDGNGSAGACFSSEEDRTLGPMAFRSMDPSAQQPDDDVTVTMFAVPAAAPDVQQSAAPVVLQPAEPKVLPTAVPAVPVPAEPTAVPEKPKKGKKKILLAVVCAVLLLAVGFAAFWLFHPHSYDAWEEVQAAACTEAGLRQRVCFCGNIETEEIAPLGHTEQIMEAIPATCLESGLTEGVCCAVCDTVLTPQEALPATGHNILTLEAVAATCTESGLSAGYECKNCVYLQVKQNEVPPLGHKYDNNACKRCGAKEWWVVFLLAKESYAVGERIEICFGIRSASDAEETVLRCKVSYKNDYGYSSSTDDPLNDGKALASEDDVMIVWEDGIPVKMTVTICIYDENDNEVGSYTFQVE